MRYALFLFLFSIILSSCRQDVDQFIPQPDMPAPFVNASLSGRVWSADGATLEAAEVLLHGQSAPADAEGFFFLPDVMAPEQGALLEARKEGYFRGLRRMYWTSRAQLNANITLFPHTLVGTLSMETGGTLFCNGGMQISFPSHPFQYENGEAAEGESRIYAHWADPSNPAFAGWLPGSARGEDGEGNSRHLQSFGVLAVEVTDESGLPLRMAEGKAMELRFPVPPSLLSDVPQTLSLWSLDTQRGIWEETSLAYLVNSTFVAEATGGVFWNVALDRPLVQVKSWVRLQDGSPASEVLVRAFPTAGTAQYATGRTQNQGFFALDLPAGEEMILQLFDLCDSMRYSQIIPPLTGNVSLTPVSWPADAAVVVKGRLLDCEETPVETGYVQVLLGEREAVFPLVEGAFSAALPLCPEGVATLIIHDLVRQYQTPPIAISASGPIDLGDMVLCNDSPEYLSFNLDGDVQYSDSPEVEVAGGLTTITDAALGVSFSFEGFTTGGFAVLPEGFNLGDLPAADLSDLDLTVVLSRFDPPGGYVTGALQGKAIDLQGQERAISGVFKIRRE